MRELVFIFVSLLFVFNSCKTESKKTIVFVNSYHPGYGSSDDVMKGLKENLPPDSIDFITFFMDTKRRNTSVFIDSISLSIKNKIDNIKPDLLVASDDNAMKHLVVPFYSGTEMPVVFCGVNWSAKQYGIPISNVTGMLEVLPLHQMFAKIKKHYPQKETFLILTEQSTSAENNRKLLDTLFVNAGFKPSYCLVSVFEEWKEAFLQGNKNFDLIYIPTNGSIKNWDKPIAEEFVYKNIHVPVLTCDDFMMPYAVYGYTKIAKEQGEWAAKTSMDILFKNKETTKIPITKNSQYQVLRNEKLAQKIQFNLK